MAVVSEFKGIFDLLSAAWTWIQRRRAPTRLQAERFVQAFEAHGIVRQQIARVVPDHLAPTASALADADKLQEVLTPKLLDWTTEFLGLNRPWLDGVDSHPHPLVDFYKEEEKFGAWLEERTGLSDVASRAIYVLAEMDPLKKRAQGYLTIIYVEDREGLDGHELSSYLRLSSEWPIEHGRCVESMLKLTGIAQKRGVLVIGRVLPRRVLASFEEGRVFASRALTTARGVWYPEDMAKLLVAG